MCQDFSVQSSMYIFSNHSSKRSWLVRHFPDQTREAFREYVAELVSRRGPSVRAIEERAGMPQGALNKFLKAERWISTENLKLFADYFRIPFDELWRRSRGEAPPAAAPQPEAKMAEAIGWAVIRSLQGIPIDQRRLLLGLAEERRPQEAGEMEEVRPAAKETETPSMATEIEAAELGTFGLSTADELMAEWKRDIRQLDPSSRKSLQLTAELIQAALRLAESGNENEAAG